jgi:hypothetical protein
LIKTGDNTAIDGTLKVLSDGNGNDLPMEVSTAGVNLTGSPTVNSVAIANTTQVAAKQDTLVSGTNIKTINGVTVLGSGNIVTPQPSGIAGAIQFSNGSAFASDAANLFWDDTNNRLGIGTTTPLGILHLKRTADTTRMVMDGDAGQSKIITYRTAGLQRFGLYVNNTAESGSNAGSDFAVRAYSDAGTLLSTPLFIQRSTGNVGINSTTPAYKLEVQGNGLFKTTTSSTPLVVAHSGSVAIQIENNATGNRLRLSTLTTYASIDAPDTYLTINPNGTKTNVGTSSNLNATLGIKGSGSTSATTSLLVQNSSANESLRILDDGKVYIGSNSMSVSGIYIPRDASFGSRTFLYNQDNVGLMQTVSNDQLRILRYCYFSEPINIQGAEIRSNSNGFYDFTAGLNSSGSSDSAQLNLNGNGRLQGSSFGKHIRIQGTMQLDSVTNKLWGFYYNPTLTGAYSNQNVFAFQSTYGGGYFNTATPQASAVLQADSTTQGFLPPRMTTAQKNLIATPATGLQVHDTDLNRPCFYNGSAWVTL